MNNEYIVVLHEKTLTTEIKPFREGIDILHQEIDCTTIDHASAIDELNDNDIDMWVDDEGLLTGRLPVFIFVTDEGVPTGQIVGNVVFETSDDKGESHGLTDSQADNLVKWIESHQIGVADTGAIYGKAPTGDECRFYIIREWETVNHRKKIADMKKWAHDNGWFVQEI